MELALGMSTMFAALAIFISFTLLLSSRCVQVTASNTGPVVQLSYGSFQGKVTADLEEFLGIPFAAPPYASYTIFACAYTDNYVLFFSRKASEVFDLLIRNRL